jgi:hypothetical protein
MDYPKDLVDAQKHIASIRRGKGLDGPNTNTSDLESALVMLVANSRFYAIYAMLTHTVCPNNCIRNPPISFRS